MSDPIEDVTPEEAHRRLTEEESAVYLDVRTVEEFEAGHPEGAWNVPIFHRGPAGMEPNPDFERVALTTLPADAPLVVGCQAGGRSRKACEILTAAGRRCVNVFGGWGGAVDPGTRRLLQAGWGQLGLPSEAGDGGERSYASLRTRTD